MATRNAGTAGGAGGSESDIGSGGNKAAGAGPKARKTSSTGAKKATGSAGAAGRTGGASASGDKASSGKSGGSKPARGKGAGAARSGAKAATSRKPAGTKAGSKTATGGRKGTAGAKATPGDQRSNPKLRSDLREFVQAHPGGWGHNEWIGLVNLLRERGHDTSDTDAIGMALERERLTLVLERVPGLGPSRVNAIADKYPRIWNVMQAGAEELATAAQLPKTVAQKVKDALS